MLINSLTVEYSCCFFYSNLSYPHIVQQPYLYGQRVPNPISQVNKKRCLSFFERLFFQPPIPQYGTYQMYPSIPNQPQYNSKLQNPSIELKSSSS